MFKIDKITHIAVLFTFALAFIVIYLYYTICDVRKLQVDVRNIQGDIAGLQKLLTSINSINKDTAPQVCEMPASFSATSVPVKVDIKQISPKEAKETEYVTVSPEVNEQDETESVSSVNTAEIRDILDVEENETAKSVPEENIPSDAEDTPAKEATWPSPEQVGTMKYDELRDFCKKHNLSTKGNRDVLIARINEAGNK